MTEELHLDKNSLRLDIFSGRTSTRFLAASCSFRQKGCSQGLFYEIYYDMEELNHAQFELL